MRPPPLKGRGAPSNPPNRFEEIELTPDLTEDGPKLKTKFYKDTTKEIFATNDSPDVGFEMSVNPYRGCEHGCIYCYARPTHEYLGFSSGLDFESKIMVKEDAPELIRKKLSSPKWKPQAVVMSGVTDPYQPVEKRLKLTRRCLEVFAEFKNPVVIITKNHLVARDVDLFAEMARFNCIKVNISVTSLDPDLASVLEPRASLPRMRLNAIKTLSEAGVPVGVMVAPVIPAITDMEVPAILAASREAGAVSAAQVLVRLPHAVKDLFAQWLELHFPDRKEKVLNRIKELRGGDLYKAQFGTRMRGEGIWAEQMEKMFAMGLKKNLFPRPESRLTTEHFRRKGQLGLF